MNQKPINYGSIIKTLRKQSNMSQSTLGEMLSVGKTAIANYESGYSIPSAPVLEKIAAIFDLDLVQFLMHDSYIKSKYENLSDPKYQQYVNTMVIRYISPSNITTGSIEAEKYDNSYIGIPGNLFEDENASYFFTKMTDNSMEADGIKKNDYVFVRKTDNIENNRIVFAIDTATNKYYIRRFSREDHVITLMPSSFSIEYPVIREDMRDSKLKIVGCVEKSLISHL